MGIYLESLRASGVSLMLGWASSEVWGKVRHSLHSAPTGRVVPSVLGFAGLGGEVMGVI